MISLLRAIERREVSVSVISHVPAVASRTVRDGLVLAAGNGDRFKNGSSESKLLQPFLGQPLILRTLHTARAAGITTFHVVLGYRARALRALIEPNVPAGSVVHFLYNPDWQLENGVSVLTARKTLRDRRFALLMGDHLFDASVLARLLRTPVHARESLLAVDSSPAHPDVAAEATKVQLSGARITAIGKQLARYDALDTGLFVCDPSLFQALGSAIADGDTTLSAGIRRLAERGDMRGVDVAGAAWFDIDTVADLETAESQLTTSRAEAV
jgi:choline kinase